MNEELYTIIEEKLNQELKKSIYDGFHEHAIASTGSDGEIETITLVARNRDKFIGAVHAKTFWGALHIKYLYVTPKARGNGIGRALMQKILVKGKQKKCRFAFVETMNFQALDFYKILGFKEEFVRSGYDKNSTFHYLKKEKL